jgi:hypothetical protein
MITDPGCKCGKGSFDDPEGGITSRRAQSESYPTKKRAAGIRFDPRNRGIRPEFCTIFGLKVGTRVLLEQFDSLGLFIPA